MFLDRRHAGRLLGEAVAEKVGRVDYVLAIPNGGVAVGYEVAKRLGARLGVVVVRKIPIPWNTEAGFGAVDPDGEVVLNAPLLSRLGLRREEVEELVKWVKKGIDERVRKYGGIPNVEGKSVVVVDDGIASGVTMIAACLYVRRRRAGSVVAAAPVAPLHSFELVKSYADQIVVLEVVDTLTFAVADYYENWYDVPDEEVVQYLEGGC
ncbi:MAG: phosphoribosyltransferase family protein [Candidatus Jordarchaeales archaeon]